MQWSPLSNSGMFLSPVLAVALGSPPCTHRQALATTSLLSAMMDFSVPFHINGLTHYVAFCVWLVSLTVFLRMYSCVQSFIPF